MRRLAPRLAAGCDAGGSSLKTALVGSDGRARAFLATRWRPGADPIAPRLAEAISGLLERARVRPRRLVGIGVALAGWLDRERETLVRSECLPGAVGEPVRRALATRFHRPVVLEADANAALLAECDWGAGRGFERVLLAAIGTGLGVAFAVAGEPVRVAHHVVGHAAHVRAGPAWIRCPCGRRGCAQASLSAGGLLARAERAGRPSRGSARDVARAAAGGDPRCARALRGYAADLGRFLGDLANMFSPDAIVLAGGMSGAWPLIGPVAREVLHREALRPPVLRPARHRRKAGALGAASAVFRLPWDERIRLKG